MFQQYEYLRNDMLDSWSKGKSYFKGLDGENEKWQKELWIGFFGKAGKFENYNNSLKDSFFTII